MSAQDQDQADDVEPACNATLTGTQTTWMESDPAAFPPGYPRLCTVCFPDATVDEEGYAPDYDHREVTDTLVRSSGGSNTNRRVHRPKGEVDL